MLEYNALIAEILARVTEQINQSGCEQAPRSKLLILAEDRGEDCQKFLEDAKLTQRFDTTCALLNDYNVVMDDMDAVILFGLTTAMTARLVGGICDTKASAMAQKALLMGKKIYVPQEEVELFGFESTATPAYYSLLMNQLNQLKSAGVVICPMDEMADEIMGQPPSTNAKPSGCAAHISCAMEAVVIDKHLVTERDMAACCTRNIGAIHVRKKAIITDLAKEYANGRQIQIIRD